MAVNTSAAALKQLTASTATGLDPIAAVERGLPIKAFDRLQETLGLSKKQLAEVVSIPVRTLLRRRRLLTHESDRVLRIGVLFQRCLEVMGDAEASRQWLQSPKRAFSGRTPLEMARTEIGAREVECLLGQLEHGVFA